MLNHEETSSYTLLIQAADQGTPQMFDNATATVTVVNVNEAPPSLSGNQTVNVSEAAPINFPVATFSASDADFTPVSITINSGNEEGKFAIDNYGMIYITGLLDFETTQTYLLGVEASDGEHSDQSFLRVHAVDENEFAPEFDSPSNFEIEEEHPSGALVGSVHATDRDGSSPNNEVTYSTTHNSFQSYFRLDSSTGEITTAATLDREELTEVFPIPTSSISVTIFAHDGGSPAKQKTTTITITLLDINDNTPEFADEYTATIFENQPSQVILTLSASDLDLGSNGNISYSFSVSPSSGNSLFQIEGNEISTTGGLDCELEASYSFTIVATDQGNPSLSSSVLGTLTLLDQNDNNPIFTENVYTFVVSEDAVIETVVGQVTATDADKGTNGEVVYSIINQDDIEVQAESTDIGVTFFEIDSNTGEIIHITLFDFESFPQVNITVQTNDRGIPRRSSTALVVFNVRNVDELRPHILDSCDDVTVSENTPINSVIVNCTAIDLDNTTTPDDPDWITYTIVSGNDDNTFMIVPNTGMILNRVELDHETATSYRLQVQATDSNGLSSKIRSLLIDILDENDNAPQFKSTSYSFMMSREVIGSQTQEIATVQARDEDSDSNGEVVYSIDDNDVEQVSKTVTRVTVTARDRGDTPQVTDVTLTVTFEDECLLQKYSVNETSGVVRADVLCAVEIRPNSTDVVLGSAHTAYCHVVRNSFTTYQWILNGNAIGVAQSLAQDEQEAVLNVDSVGYEDAGVYACKVTTEAGSLQTSTYSLSILVPPTITNPPQSSSTQEGSNAEFRCNAIGTPLPSIHWEFGGEVVGNETTLTIENAAIFSQGEYSCVATNSAGVSSAVATLIVYKLENVVQMVLNRIDQPNQESTCHYLDLKGIQDTLTTLSRVTTMVTPVTGDNLCEVTPCSPSPCQNQGSCLLDESVKGGYRCTCQDGYQGAECEEDVDECLADPCGADGVCTNTPGFYQCECSGSAGHRCQYPDSCGSDSCSEGELCIESLTRLSGYFCEVLPDLNELLVVVGAKVNPGFFDDLLITYREELLQQAANNRRKRQDADIVTIFTSSLCTPRFKQLEDSTMYALFWDCPDGSSRPNTTIESMLCQRLLQSGLIESCKPSNVTTIKPPPPPSLPKISVTLWIIQVDDSGQSLTAGEVLKSLVEVAEELEKSDSMGGARVGEISALNLTSTPGKEESEDNSGAIAGSVVVVVVAILAIITLGTVIIAYVRFTKHQEHKKREALKKRYAELETVQTEADVTPPLVSSTTKPVDENIYDALAPKGPHETSLSEAASVQGPDEVMYVNLKKEKEASFSE